MPLHQHSRHLLWPLHPDSPSTSSDSGRVLVTMVIFDGFIIFNPQTAEYLSWIMVDHGGERSENENNGTEREAVTSVYPPTALN
jgi:hypothetical protein